MHTTGQVLTGIIIGLIYVFIYIFNKISIYSFLFVFSIGFLLTTLTIQKIDSFVYAPIPQWVSPSMIPSIRKKQNAPYHLKLISIYANAIIQQKTFITWNELEYFLDKIILKIQKEGIQYDALIGIKTGGAIISDYISRKLNLPNYKIKLTKNEYNCNKKPNDTINDVIQRQFLNNYGKYTICEGINDNLKGKNIILMDEMVSSGTTMDESIQYLKKQKHVNHVFPVCISLSKKRYKKYIPIHYILPSLVFVWPWGYDN
jgi:hypoxanthine phosphoribosyltransferase